MTVLFALTRRKGPRRDEPPCCFSSGVGHSGSAPLCSWGLKRRAPAPGGSQGDIQGAAVLLDLYTGQPPPRAVRPRPPQKSLTSQPSRPCHWVSWIVSAPFPRGPDEPEDHSSWHHPRHTAPTPSRPLRLHCFQQKPAGEA